MLLCVVETVRSIDPSLEKENFPDFSGNSEYRKVNKMRFLVLEKSPRVMLFLFCSPDQKFWKTFQVFRNENTKSIERTFPIFPIPFPEESKFKVKFCFLKHSITIRTHTQQMTGTTRRPSQKETNKKNCKSHPIK